MLRPLDGTWKTCIDLCVYHQPWVLPSMHMLCTHVKEVLLNWFWCSFSPLSISVIIYVTCSNVCFYLKLFITSPSNEYTQWGQELQEYPFLQKACYSQDTNQLDLSSKDACDDPIDLRRGTTRWHLRTKALVAQPAFANVTYSSIRTGWWITSL